MNHVNRTAKRKVLTKWTRSPQNYCIKTSTSADFIRVCRLGSSEPTVGKVTVRREALGEQRGTERQMEEVKQEGKKSSTKRECCLYFVLPGARCAPSRWQLVSAAAQNRGRRRDASKSAPKADSSMPTVEAACT